MIFLEYNLVFKYFTFFMTKTYFLVDSNDNCINEARIEIIYEGVILNANI